MKDHYEAFVPEGKDPVLWRQAQERSSFKHHLAIYLLINAFLWGVWFFSSPSDLQSFRFPGSFPWPAWTTFGWGIGLLMHYLKAYHLKGFASVEKEYEKLTNNK